MAKRCTRSGAWSSSAPRTPTSATMEVHSPAAPGRVRIWVAGAFTGKTFTGGGGGGSYTFSSSSSSCKGFTGAGDRMIGMTRRDFGRRALTGVSSWAVCSAVNGSGLAFHAQAAPTDRSGNRSLIGGVQFGLQPFCYHDLAMTPDNRGTLIKRLVQNGFGMVELHATWVEPRFDGSRTAAEAREKLRGWRLSRPFGSLSQRQEGIRRRGDYDLTATTSISTTAIPTPRSTPCSTARKLLGASGCVGSQGLEVSRRLAPFPGKHGMFLGIHNHDNLSDPDAFNTEESFVKGLAFSPDVKATLDTRHFTAAERRLPRVPAAASRAHVERAPRRPAEEQRPKHAVWRGGRADHRGAPDDSRQPVADRRAARVRARHAAAPGRGSPADVRLLQAGGPVVVDTTTGESRCHFAANCTCWYAL